jgi:AcrR family transcriptional regulator
MAKRRNDMEKDVFIAAAEKLITEKGANDFSLADLAKEMGISKGTLYYHYPSKDDLILDIMEKHMNELSKDYIEWLDRHENDTISPQRFLDVIFYKGVKLFNKSKMHIYLINECMRGNASLKKRYSELWHSWQDKLEEGIDRYSPDKKDHEAYAYLLMLLIDGLTVQEALENSDNAINERVKSLLVGEVEHE